LLLFKILNQEGIEKNLIATNLMVAGDSWVGKVMVCWKKMVCDL
jgi:hypothetical protein